MVEFATNIILMLFFIRYSSYFISLMIVLYIYIYPPNASQNLQLCIEITHQNGTLGNDLILPLFQIKNENFDLTSSNKQPITYRELFRGSQTYA